MSSFVGSLPLGTRLVVFANLSFWVYSRLAYPEVGQNMYMTARAVARGEWWRVFAAAFEHSDWPNFGWSHITFNMLAALFIGARVEPTVGTAPLLGLVLLFVVLGGVLFVGLSWAVAKAYAADYWVTPTVGYSGVLFSLIMVDTHVVGSPYDRRSVFGFFAVPAYVYPWVLLVVLSVAMKNVSFVGHLSGALVGYAYSRGWLGLLALPREWILAAEGRAQWVATAAPYARCPEEPPVEDPAWVAAVHRALRRAAKAVAGACRRCRAAPSRIRAGAEERAASRRQQRNAYAPVAEAPPPPGQEAFELGSLSDYDDDDDDDGEESGPAAAAAKGEPPKEAAAAAAAAAPPPPPV